MDHQPVLIVNFKQLTDSQKYQLAQQLGTVKGFYTYYFNQLPNFNTQSNCFNAVNLLHFKIFNTYKYEDYNSFRRALTYHLQKNKR